MKFCPKCGNRNVKDRFCADCRPKEKKNKKVRIKQCKECFKIFSKGLWRNKVVAKVMKEVSKKTPDVGTAVVYDVCPECNRLKSNYFEAILQLRNPNEEAVMFVRNFFQKKGRKARITKQQKVRGGIDFYSTSSNSIKRLVKSLNQHFGGYVKLNYKLHTRNKQTSKDVYRMQALFRMLDYKVGDVVEVNGRPVFVLKLGDKMVGHDLEKDKHVSMKPEDYPVIKQQKTRVIKVKPFVEVMDPETYQGMAVMNAGYKKVVAGQKVTVVESGGKLYII